MQIELSGGAITNAAMTILNYLCDAFGDMDSLSAAPPESPTPGDEWHHD